MAYRRKKTWAQIIPALIILLIFGLVGIVASIRSSREEARAQEEAAIQASIAAHEQEMEQKAAEAYNDAMAVLEVEGYTCPETATKAVTRMTIDSEENSQGIYEKNYIPEAYIAESPEEVRYIFHCHSKSVLFGEYLGGGNAYQLEYNVQILDLLSGEVIAENTFLGKEPPSSVKAGSGDHTGSPPKADEITAWIDSVLSA